MVSAGAVAVSDDGKPVVSSHLMRTALEYAHVQRSRRDHCETRCSPRRRHARRPRVHAPRVERHSAAAEEIMVARDILLAELTGGHVHLCHMSARGSVAIIREAKSAVSA